MKLSLVAAVALSIAAVACGADDPSPLRNEPAPPTTAEPTPASPPRKLIEGKAMATSPTNLLADPSFDLTSGPSGYGSFLAFYDDSFSPIDLVTTFDSRSPAGFSGNVALVKPTGATNTRSDAVMILTSFQGGAGPFRAQVWVSRSDVAGAPAEVTNDARGIRASITDETPEGDAFDLVPVEGAARTSGGRTWVLLRGEVQKPLPYGGFIVIRTGTGGGQFHIAAPEIVAQPLVDAQAVRGARAAVKARAKTSGEREAIRRYKQRPQRLVPASSKHRSDL